MNRNNPTVVPALRGKKVLGGATGRSHSAVFTAAGESFTFGLNSAGQLGTGSVRKAKGGGEDMQFTPQTVRARVAGGGGGVGWGGGESEVDACLH